MKLAKARQDFPLLQQQKIIYFDNACMTLRPRQVWQAMEKYYKQFPACPDRSHHKLSQQATEALESSREQVRDFLGASKREEILFTRNTTEAINLVANSLNSQPGDEVITSDREHNSNLIPWQQLQKRQGIEHTVVASKADHRFSLENFKQAISQETKLVSVVHTSNLDGYTLPVKDIIDIAHEQAALVLVDGAQSAPHKPIDVSKLDADFFAMSGHKVCGPSGMGCLYVKQDLFEQLDPFLVGGETVTNSWYQKAEFASPPERYEAGLQNAAGAIGFGRACEYVEKVGKNKIEQQEAKLNQMITEGLEDEDKIDIIGVKDWQQRSGIFNFTVKGKDAHEIGTLLDETSNIAVRTGMHCLHSWYNAHNLEGSVRASLYFYNTAEEAEKFVNKLTEIVNYLA